MTKKRILALGLILMLLLGAMQSASASTGDATLYHADSSDGYFQSVENVFLMNNRVYYITGNTFKCYDIATKQEESYDASAFYDSNNFEDAAALTVTITDEDGDEYTSVPSISLDGLFVYKDEMYALMNFSTYSDDNRTVDGGYIYRLVFEGDAVQFEKADLPKLDWTDMIETYDTYSYSRYISSSFVCGDYLIAETYNDEGYSTLYSFDLTSGRSAEHYVQDLYAVTPVGDGRLLVMTYLWSETDSQAEFLFYDLTDDSTTPAGTYEVIDYSLPSSLYYVADSDALYYTISGEIKLATGFDFDNAVTVNDSPVSSSSNVQMTEDGYLLLYDWENIVLRNTNPDERAEVTLRVADFGYENAVDTAYFKYTNEHGDVSVIIARDGTISDVLQAMMNRSSDVDIYTMNVSASEYSALFERGYMAELDGSEKLTTAVTDMYSNLQSAVTKDGHIYAVPLSMHGSTMGYNPQALEKLGLTAEDMPTTWEGFFDFLEQDLPALLTEDCGVRAFESYYAQSDLKRSIFSMIFNSYQNYLNNSDNVEYAFNTPELKQLVDRLENLDLGALDVLEVTYDEENDIWYDDYDDRIYLFETYVGVTIGDYYSAVPMILGFGDSERQLPVTLTVGFVNPFSENVDKAIEYLEVMADSLSTSDAYCFYADRNEPVRYSDFEEYKANMAEWIEEAKKTLDENNESLEKLRASDDADEDEIAELEEVVANYEEYIADMEESLANMDDTYWLIGPDAIAAYRERAPYLTPITYDCTYATGGSDDSTDTVWGIVIQYFDGAISADEMLTSIDKKVQMMRLEGN